MEQPVYRILLIDDDLISSTTTKKLLEKRGYLVDYVNDPHDFSRAQEEFQPHILLLDINMPHMSGLDLLVSLRKTWHATDLPVLMLSANDSDDDVVRALELGANDYLTKPINIAIAEARIQAQIRVLESARYQAASKQAEAINAMITTYNHEINNPLAVAVSLIKRVDDKPENREKIEMALKRITEIVRKIRDISPDRPVEFKPYVSGSKMVKI